MVAEERARLDQRDERALPLVHRVAARSSDDLARLLVADEAERHAVGRARNLVIASRNDTGRRRNFTAEAVAQRLALVTEMRDSIEIVHTSEYG